MASATAAESLALAVHTLNVNAGWWHDKRRTGEPLERNFPELLMLTVSEIGEAWDGDGQKDDKLPTRKAIEVELADVLIRVFDWIGAMELPVPNAFAAMTHADRAILTRPSSTAAILLDMVCNLSSVMEIHRKGGSREQMAKHTAYVILQVIRTSYELDMAVDEAFIEKLRYNLTRPDHLPSERVKEGGKDY